MAKFNSSVDKTYTILQDSKSVSAAIETLYENSIFSWFSKSSNKPNLSKRSQHQDMQESKEKLEKELDEAKVALSQCSEEVSRLKEECERLKKINEDRLNHDEIISKKKAELEKEYLMLKKTKVSSDDIEQMEKMKFQYTCLRNMTQIRFSYGSLESDILEGYIFNQATNYISYFSIETSKNDDQIQERLRELMEKASHPNFADLPSE